MTVNQETLLNKRYPEIAQDWFAEKNANHTLAEVRWSSKERVWWRCEHGHEYEASVYTRVRTQGCKICRKGIHGENLRLAKLRTGTSFAIAKPELVAQWHETRNLPLTPDSISQKSHKLIWWKCADGHEWQSTPQRRSRGDGCPQCYQRNRGQILRTALLKRGGITFAEVYPELLTEWDRERNAHDPAALSPKSNVRAHWVCKFGHHWEATITNRTNNNSGCPFCVNQSSRLEIFLLCELRALFQDVRWREKIGGFECDIFIPKLQIGIEVDGEYWHKTKHGQELRKNDAFRSAGIVLIRVRHEGLAAIDGHVFPFSKSMKPIDIAASLVGLINRLHPASHLIDYTLSMRQHAEAAYKKMLAHLPAPTEGESLADKFPIVAADWDYAANEPLTPQLFSAGSEQRVAWVCTKGHKWQATIKNRTLRNSGCMACFRETAGEKLSVSLALKNGSIATKRPDLLAHWDYSKNAGLNPAEIAPGSGRKVWWKCNNGHESYLRVVDDMARPNRGCPKCYKDRFA